MRWNDVCFLLAWPDMVQDEAGNVIHGQPERRMRYCNRFTVGSDLWATSFDVGLRADALIQLRADEYSGESEVEFGGVQYDVENASVSGEFVKLQLGRHVSNG